MTSNLVEKYIKALYGDRSGYVIDKIDQLIEKYRSIVSKDPSGLSEKDIFLITYGDMVKRAGEPSLGVLAEFLSEFGSGAISHVHILPFYPYTSDDGFSVIDYFKINPQLGDWSDVERMSSKFKLMFDAVVNHCSVSSEYFQNFLARKEGFRNFFTASESFNPVDYSSVRRPRTHPLLTPFDTADGRRFVWTTFSADQVDLNVSDPAVCILFLEILLFYVRGARAIRLDAIGFLWKRLGSECIHLWETHALVRVARAVVEAVSPGTLIITETNVPHAENVSYFGGPPIDLASPARGVYEVPALQPQDAAEAEAHLVYNFSLPVLAAYSLVTEDASILTRWAAEALSPPVPGATFFNFTASHDGVGITPAKGYLPDRELSMNGTLARKCLENGGFVSTKKNPDGSESPYELNCVYYDLVSSAADSEANNIDRFMLSQVLAASLPGVPAFYFHSVFGSRNDTASAAQGYPRLVNREKFDADALAAELRDGASFRHKVYSRMLRLMQARRACRHLHPNAAFRVVAPARHAGGAALAVWRARAAGSDGVLCLFNFASRDTEFWLPKSFHVRPEDELLNGGVCAGSTQSENGPACLRMRPLQCYWIPGRASAPDESE